MFGDSVVLPSNQIIFGSTSLTVTGPTPPLSSAAGVFTHNAANAYDVNADGSVSPLDALLVINAMEQGFESAGTHTDVNEDAGLSPIDALLVINELVVADAGLASTDGGVNSDVSQADLQSAFEFVFEQLDDEELTVNELAGLDSSLIVAILQASAADQADQDGLWQQLAEDLASALSD